MKMKEIIIPVLVALVISLNTSAQNLVVNGSFETPTIPPGHTPFCPGDNIAGWMVVTSCVDLVCAPYWQAADGQQSLAPSGLRAGGLRQLLPTVSGQIYRLRFALAGDPILGPTAPSPLKHLSIRWGETLVTNLTFDVTGRSITNMGWEYYSYMLVAQTNTTELLFLSQDDDSGGPVIDDVSVELVGPELSIRCSQVEICWDTVTNFGYQLQYRSDLTTNVWVPFDTDFVRGTGTVICSNDSVFPGQPQRYYRVAVTNQIPGR